ncbi:hypothetical protein [Paraburkholderia sp. PGU19]|uniref:hypothetical protein n=1 Tax=Paraburkholderia sp. PGU19 TaxID=2735434 RepID=UPI0015D9A56D|nr:hypothetical protein [Paraburkholderia sp. PGU19]
MKHVLFAAVIGGFIDALAVHAGALINLRVLSVPFVGALCVTACGEWILSRMRVTSLVAWLPAAFVTGTAATSIAIFALTIIGTLSAQTAFIVWSAAVVLVWLVWPPRPIAQSGNWLDIGATVGFALLCGYFSRDVAGFLPTAPLGRHCRAGWISIYMAPLSLRSVILWRLPAVTFF